MNNNNHITVEPKDVIILILGIQNEIVGFTRFVKYLFLASQNDIFGKNEPSIDWKAHHYGPYWEGFDSVIKSLECDRLLKLETINSLSGRSVAKFSITIKGRKYFQDLYQQYENELNDLTPLIKFHQKKSLIDLLKFVYENYPEFSTRPRLREAVLEI